MSISGNICACYLKTVYSAQEVKILFIFLDFLVNMDFLYYFKNINYLNLLKKKKKNSFR